MTTTSLVSGITNSILKPQMNGERTFSHHSRLFNDDFVPIGARLTLGIISAAVILFLLWSSLTTVNEVSHAEGQVVPDGYVQLVQHLEGGIVKEIKVKEGDRVTKDQPLLVLEGAGSQEELAESKARLLALELQSERLYAFVENKIPDFSRFSASEELVSEQKKIFNSMMAAKNKEKAILEQQLAQRKEHIKALKLEAETLADNASIARESRDIQKNLLAKGLANRSLYLKRQEELNNVEGRIRTAKVEAVQAVQQISEFEGRLASLEADYMNKSYDELHRVESEISQLKETVKRNENRVNRLVISAPVDGYVKGLKINTLGSVVGTGETLMEIVPLEKPLIVDIKISPNDIGHIKPGQEVYVKVDSFDFSRYGSINGVLESISATTFTANDNQSYYKGRVTLAQNHVGSNPSANIIMAGMTIDADIVTGDKSILSYMLKPIKVIADSAMTER